MADYFVDDATSFIAAAGAATEGDRLLVQADINLSGYKQIALAAGVAVRGDPEMAPGLTRYRLYSTDEDMVSATPFLIAGAGCRFRGIHIQGPHAGQDDYATKIVGLHVTGPRVNIYDCEVSGWSHAGVNVASTGCIVDCCYIHHNQAAGYGYGLLCTGTSDLIARRSTFLTNRHGIDISDGVGRSFTVVNNFFGQVEGTNTMPVNTHGATVNGVIMGGDRLTIAYNVFDCERKVGAAGQINGIGFEGTPRVGAFVHDNYFLSGHGPRTFNQATNITFRRNRFSALGSGRNAYMLTAPVWIDGRLVPAGDYALNTWPY